MYPTRARATYLEVHAHRDAFVALLDQLLSQVNRQIEGVALYAILCVFWGLILFAATGFTLP